jgi:hypothetical protein
MRASLALLVVMACSDDSTNHLADAPVVDARTVDALVAPDAPSFPAFHPPVPQITPTRTPPIVIATPTFVPVYFAGDADQAALDAFIPGYAASPMWSALAQYGVGSATVAASIVLTDTPPGQARDADIGAFLLAKLGSGALGATDEATLANEIFLMYYPTSTDLILNDGNTMCVDQLSGYYDAVLHPSGAEVSYAVVAHCDQDGFLENRTNATGFGMAATATDPFFNGSNQGWGTLDADHVGWLQFVGTDVTELCFEQAITITGHSANSVYSNRDALAGREPCVGGTEPYFNAAPVAVDALPNGEGSGVLVPLGGSATVDVQLFSDAATSGPWSVTATSLGGSATIALDGSAGTNGDVLHATLTASGSDTGGFQIQSQLGSVTHQWILPYAVH